MSSFTEYEVDLRTSLAKQLWNGREKKDGKTFIPGLLDFHQQIASLPPAPTSKRIADIETTIAEIQRELFAWRSELAGLAMSLLPANTRYVSIGLKSEIKQIRFAQTTTRKLALLIAQFDEISCLAITVENSRNELGLMANHRPTEPTMRIAKRIKAIIHSPRNTRR